MPLFHDPHRRPQYRWSGDRDDHEQLATSSRDQSCEDSERGLDGSDTTGIALESTPADLYPPKVWTNDRQEIIHRIKESSPWRRQYMSQTNDKGEQSLSPDSPEKSNQRAEEQIPRHTEDAQQADELGSPADIQRPRSALHSGDFREGIAQDAPQSPRPAFAERFPERNPSCAFPRLGTSPTTPWFAAQAFGDSGRNSSTLEDHREPQTIFGNRSRAPSLGSFSSSYVLKVPTSPLVHQANNTDLDFSPRAGPADPTHSERAHRRRTLPPETFRQLQGSPPAAEFVNIHSPCPPRQQDGFYNYPSPPRRSLTSAYSLQLASTVNTPAYRARRPSLASDVSPKPHAPMVGSYEESILRGRMSMNPSKPLDFTAQIGVLGKGKCKGHLKCPPHVTVPFPAFFYSYPTSGNGRSISDDSPSPYVGQIDLENSLSKDDASTTRRRRRHVSPSKSRENKIPEETSATRVPSAETQRRREKKNRRAESPKSPPGGCYRIPQQGQLQIIIKNPHKTAVKLFLVPYDLDDMEPGTKTFIRQRSYSAGPVLDMPLSARNNYGTDRPEASLNTTEDPQDKPTLRYLIHLNICCPARGRFYLHSSIRVVFANRVPDGKEKLRNEIQLPEPRYSPYKPSREPAALSSSVGARLAIDKASRRRSIGQGTMPLLCPHATSPSDVPLNWSPGQSLDMLSSPQSSQVDTAVYNKLNKGDVGYGGYPYPSSQNGSDNGESLLAKRLRGLDVQRHEKFDNS